LESHWNNNLSTEGREVNNIFKGIYASEIYPILKGEHYGGVEAGVYMLNLLNRLGIKEGKILDVCCGEFTDGLYLINRGYKVDGLDGSEEFLAIARKKAPLSAFICSNVQEDWVKEPGYYNLTYMMASWFLVDDPRGLVDSLSRAITKGGYFVFDFSNKDAFTEGVIEKDEDFSTFSRKVKVDIQGNIRTAEYKYYIDGNTIPVKHVTRLYTVWEVAEILGPNFIIEDGFSGLSFSPANWSEDKIVTIVAKRN